MVTEILALLQTHRVLYQNLNVLLQKVLVNILHGTE